jgi:hypothetical protein
MPSKEEIQRQIDENAHRILAERQVREVNQKLAQAKKLRLEYMLHLNDLGLHEGVRLDYTPKGMFPRIEVGPLTPEQSAEARTNIEDALSQLSNTSTDSGLITD